MESSQFEKKTKPSKSSSFTSVHMRKETKRRISVDLVKINRKDFGRTVRADEYLALAVSLITPDQIRQLQENSLSNADRLERDYRTYTAKFGHLSKDEYLGKRLTGEIGNQMSSSQETTEISNQS